MSVCVYRMCLYMHWRPEGDKERICSLYIGHILVNVFIVYLLLLYYNIHVYLYVYMYIYVWDCVHVCIYTMEYLMCIQFVHSIYECVGVCVCVLCV